MNELFKYELEVLYPMFVENGVSLDSIWSLTKQKLDEFKVPYTALKRYLQKTHNPGNNLCLI